MTKRRRYSDGFAAPIHWGAAEGYTPPEIAAGLMIDVETVLDVLLDPRTDFTDEPPQRRQPLDYERTDPAYRAWLRQTRGATRTRRDNALNTGSSS
ncbi:hypothetical protein [Microcystis phage Mwe-Yong1]|nr:hypothetical protein [Microcystis phage Mwe-Yong1]